MEETVLMAQSLFNKIADAGITLHGDRYAVNIGCWDGKDFNDPVYPLFATGFVGLAIDAADVPALSETLGQFPVVLRPATLVHPGNIVSILRDAGCPPNFEFLKVDIDGFDAAVTAKILESGMRPLAIQMEVNSEIPPPVSFSVCWHENYLPGGEFGFYGCSLAYAVDVLKEYDYALAELDFTTWWTHDALFVQRSMLAWGIGLSDLDPRQAFLNQPPHVPHISSASTEQKLAWREETDFERLRDAIWVALSMANEQKHGHREVPFELYLST